MKYPVLPLRDHVVFPRSFSGLYVGRAGSLEALRLAGSGHASLLICTQNKPEQNDPACLDDFLGKATLSTVSRMVMYPDGQSKVIVQGEQCMTLTKVWMEENVLWGEGNLMSESETLPLLESEAQATCDLLRAWLCNPANEEVSGFLEALEREREIGRYTDILCSALTRWRQHGPLKLQSKSEASVSRESFKSTLQKRLDLYLDTTSRDRLTRAQGILREEIALE